MGSETRLAGTLVTVRGSAGQVRDAVTAEYRTLLDEYDHDEVLVLTAAPTSSDVVRGALEDAVPGASVPRVTSLLVQATDVVRRTDERAILSDHLRRALLARFLEDYEWETAYLRRASARPSFVQTVDRLVETATWQGTSFEETPELVEIGAARDAFHEWLDEHDHLERGQLVATATRAIEASNRGREERHSETAAGNDESAVESDAETDGTDGDLVAASAILAVEVEEYFPPDRRFLAALADGRELVCVAERDASVRRARMETGPACGGLDVESTRSVSAASPASRPAAVAAHLARGAAVADPGDGDVSVLREPTRDDQYEAVADEIERLCAEGAMRYEDVAVVARRGADVTDAIRTLEQCGVPTASASVLGLGDDPAVRELLTVTRALAGAADDRPTVAAGHPTLDADLLDEVATMDELEPALRRWATATGLKARIAADAHPLDARAQFANVRRVFGVAEFLDDADVLDADWAELRDWLELAHERAPVVNHTNAIDRDGGVRVDHVGAVRNGAFEAVFLLDVVDETYPGDHDPSDLFPSTRVPELPDYPGVTTVTEAEVDATFATTSTASSRPLRRYHVELARRELAVGAATATDRLYCCTYEYEDGALEERVQPSRFLRSLFVELPWLTAAVGGDDDRAPVAEGGRDGAGTGTAPADPEVTPIRSEREAEAYVLSRVDRALDDVRRCASQDVTVSLDELERDLADVQALLADSGERGDRLRDALRARVDVERGRIRRIAPRRATSTDGSEGEQS